MSEATLKAIEDAIEAHVKEEHSEDAMASDWFLAVGMITSDGTDTFHNTVYASSESPGHSIYGLASLCVDELKEDLLHGSFMSDEDEE